MRKTVLFLLVFMAIASAGFARKAAISEIINFPDTYNGKVVEVKGEVIGVLPRKNGAWVNISHGASIGVW